jgi:hypothetical protein
MRHPRIQSPGPLLGEIVALVAGGEAAELGRLVREQLVDGDGAKPSRARVEAPVRRRSCRT